MPARCACEINLLRRRDHRQAIRFTDIAAVGFDASEVGWATRPTISKQPAKAGYERSPFVRVGTPTRPLASAIAIYADAADLLAHFEESVFSSATAR